MGIAQTVTWIGSAPLIRSCAERTGLPLLNISRQLAPELFAMNKQGALNGHIPVTAVNSAILVLAALLHERRSGGVFQRTLGQLRQPDRGHRRGQPPVVERLGFRARVSPPM